MTSTDTNFYSDLLEAETAELARKAAIEATKAYNKTVEMDNKISNTEYGLSAIKSEILNIKSAIDANIQAPIINYIKGENNATATLGSDIVIDTSVSNATHYRIKGEDWNTYVNNQITVTGVNKGLNKIEIEFGNFIIKEEGLVGNTCKGIVNIFGL